MGRLDGKVAIVTGAARGIGLEYALRLAELGANIAICDINLKSYEEYDFESSRISEGDVIKEIVSRYDVEAYGSEVDVTNSKAVKKFIDEVYEKWGRIDILVCNAGGGIGDPLESKASELDFIKMQAVIDRNLLSTVYTVVAAAPYMKKQRSGKIINVASMAGMRSSKGVSADYGVSKAAVAHYTRTLAQDLASYDINVNAIAPGLVATGQFQTRFSKDDGDKLDKLSRTVPLGRLATPKDCANVIEFLATSLSDYVTGQIIVVDGGITGGFGYRTSTENE